MLQEFKTSTNRSQYPASKPSSNAKIHASTDCTTHQSRIRLAGIPRRLANTAIRFWIISFAINLIVIGGGLIRLSGCANLRKLPTSHCPEALDYTAQEWQKIDESVAELPEQSAFIPVLQDYMDLLDKLKVCNHKL